MTSRGDPSGGEPGDDILLARFGQGDAEAFALLVERHLAWVMSISQAILGDRGDAQDIAQEAMLRLWRHGKTLDVGTSGAKPWLRKVTSNLCLDRLRVLKAKATIVTDDLPEQAVCPVQLDRLSEQDLAHRVELALRQLPARQRLAIVLFHFEGLSQKEITQIMEVSQDGVEALLARARRKLKSLLRDEWRHYLPETDH